jgi:tryptophan 2,3-dioxygenase
MPITEYERYLRVPELLALQKPTGTRTHDDELLFQVVHQVEELWMKACDDEISRLAPALAEGKLEIARAGLHRIYLMEKLMGEQLRLLETMAPLAYFHIRKGLGHGSGLESPGFSLMIKSARKVDEAFQVACKNRNLTPVDLLRDPSKDAGLWAVAEAMVDVDQSFQNFRYQHMQLVRRIIGSGTPSLKGNAIELLEKNARHAFFPALWQAREVLFQDFVPGELKT